MGLIKQKITIKSVMIKIAMTTVISCTHFKQIVNIIITTMGLVMKGQIFKSILAWVSHKALIGIKETMVNII